MRSCSAFCLLVAVAMMVVLGWDRSAAPVPVVDADPATVEVADPPLPAAGSAATAQISPGRSTAVQTDALATAGPRTVHVVDAIGNDACQRASRVQTGYRAGGADLRREWACGGASDAARRPRRLRRATRYVSLARFGSDRVAGHRRSPA